MSNIPQGRKSRFTLAGVDITGIGHGTDNITRTRARDYQRITGLRGLAAGQLGPHILHDFAFSCASNTIHDPVLRAANGVPTPFTYEPVAGTGLRYSAMAVPTTQLLLDPRTDAARWTVTMAVDGSPTTAAAPADNRTPGAIERYKAAAAIITFDGQNLTPLWDTSLTLQGVVINDRHRVLPTPPAETSGITADPQDIGYTANIGIRYSAAVLDAIDADPTGPFVLTRTDAAWVATIPMVVVNITDTSPASAAYTVRVDLAQHAAGVPVFAAT